VFVRPIREHVVATVVSQIDRLIAAHPGGSIAVITTLSGPITVEQPDGPERPNVVVLGPNQARGLEFDAAIVVEPDDFPVNDHRRHGLLYTALTRPNKELVVVHSKDLPLQLQNIVTGVARRVPAPPPRRTPERKAAKKGKKAKRKRGQGRGGRVQPYARNAVDVTHLLHSRVNPQRDLDQTYDVQIILGKVRALGAHLAAGRRQYRWLPSVRQHPGW
jgi:hypothetical protein